MCNLIDGVVGAFETYSSNLFNFCYEILTKLEENNPKLQRPFEDSAFGSLSFNFGPGAGCFPHRDFNNLSWGWCAVTAFGDYDYKQGGHLILWDLGIAIEFPPYSTILIPSAILKHSNTRALGCRSVVTQYNSSGIFRWVAYGFKPKAHAERQGVNPEGWWAKPRHMFERL